mmetsp:Transcript_6205/g.12198  ORF Transcript_6205/g.12198 Transcript_6205/m.12198 type:complete len:256 (+) Transcript_6205:886-1653(+)|eukprot:CAMPEP_0118800052 /NCGR_PEP_ID=MMETSP1161-20130426/2071_1 /TAXON_ID=249345 /ORGANISM="Picochlorum oklahomensis, Strain CCMP2329" /LENGTH=255 /DNA_ID=CAMNT_0006727831 /DNA_START=1453 /DNA_END=2220 /DNA_ORIENTATION=+
MGRSNLNGAGMKGRTLNPDDVKVVCGHEDTRKRYNLTEDTEKWPFMMLEVTSAIPISVERVYKIILKIVNSYVRGEAFILCSEYARSSMEEMKHVFYVVLPDRLRASLEQCFHDDEAVKLALRCMHSKSISKITSGRPNMRQRACLLAQVMAFVQCRTQAFGRPLKKKSDWSEGLQRVLGCICGSERIQQEAPKVRKAQITLLEASGVVSMSHQEEHCLQISSEGPALSPRGAVQLLEVGTIMECRSDYAERPRN